MGIRLETKEWKVNPRSEKLHTAGYLFGYPRVPLYFQSFGGWKWPPRVDVTQSFRIIQDFAYK